MSILENNILLEKKSSLYLVGGRVSESVVSFKQTLNAIHCLSGVACEANKGLVERD